MSDEKVLNADLRYLPIEVAGHKVTVDALINVAVGLEWDMAFGVEYLNRFDLRETPTLNDLNEWLSVHADGEYAKMIDTEHRQILLDRMGRIQAELVTAEIRQMADEKGFHCMVLEVNTK